MTQEAETVAMDLNMVSCQTCDAMFVESERRQTCPYCGGPPVGPYFQFVLDGAGLHQKDGAAASRISHEEAVQGLKDLGYSEEEAEARVGAGAPEVVPPDESPFPASPAAEEAVDSGLRTLTPVEVLPVAMASFLEGGAATEEDLRGMLGDVGAEPEAAAIAVGRLAAVRDLLRELVEDGQEAQVEVAVEETPAEPPEGEGELTT